MDRILDHSGARLWSVCEGSAGTPMILCNGGPGCDDYLGPVAAMVIDICRVVRFEPRGCGRSARDKRYDFSTTVDDIDFVRRSYGFEKPIVVGHSAGVDLALAYAMKYSTNVLGIIGICGGRMVNDREWHRIYNEKLEAIGEDMGGKVFDADPDVNLISNASWKQYITRPTLWQELSRIQVPAVFISGGADIRPSWPTMQLAALLPRSRYTEISGAQHYAWLTHADELRRHLRAAVQEIGRGT